MSKDETLKNFQKAYGEYIDADNGIINEAFKAAFVRMSLARNEALNAGHSDSELDGVAADAFILRRRSARTKSRPFGVV